LGLSLSYTTFPICNIGNTLKDICLFFNGKSKFNKLFLDNDFINLSLFGYKSSRLVILYNTSSNQLNCSFPIQDIISISSDFMSCYCKILAFSKEVGRVAYAEVVPLLANAKNNSKAFNYYFGIDVEDIDKEHLTNSFSVYQGHFIPTTNINFFNLLLPTVNHIEHSNIYLNINGYMKESSQIITPHKGLRTNYNIIRAVDVTYNLYINTNIIKFYYNNLNYFQSRVELQRLCKFKSGYQPNFGFVIKLAWRSKIHANLMHYANFNYYSTDIFCKNSRIMALCASKIKLVNLIYDAL